LDKVPLLFGLKQEYEPPRDDTVERPIEERRFHNGLARDRHLWQVVSERRHQRRRRIDTIDIQPFANQDFSNGKTRPAT